MSTLSCCPSSISSADHGVGTLQGPLKHGFGEAVMTRDMPEPCEFPPLDSRQKRFVWAHKEVDLAPHPVVGLTLQEDAEKFPRALGYEILDVFVRVSKQGPYLTATEENEGDKRLVQLEPAWEAYGVASPDPA